MPHSDPESHAAHIDENACLRTEGTLASQQHIGYNAKQWAAFTVALNSPAQDRPRLKKLLTEPSVLED